MLDLIALLIMGILTIVSLIHFYWGFGGLWPAKSEQELAKTVVGTQADQMPGRVITIIVAILIFMAGYIAAAQTELVPQVLPIFVQQIAVFVLAGIFLARGIVSYIPAMSGHFGVEPFARLNRLYFSPLCLLLGLGYVCLIIL